MIPIESRKFNKSEKNVNESHLKSIYSKYPFQSFIGNLKRRLKPLSIDNGVSMWILTKFIEIEI